jgi:hypothetical protein
MNTHLIAPIGFFNFDNDVISHSGSFHEDDFDFDFYNTNQNIITKDLPEFFLVDKYLESNQIISNDEPLEVRKMFEEFKTNLQEPDFGQRSSTIDMSNLRYHQHLSCDDMRGQSSGMSMSSSSSPESCGYIQLPTLASINSKSMNETTAPEEDQSISINSVSKKVSNKSKKIKSVKQLLREEERLICKSKGRKTQKQQEILMKAFQKYNGKWDENNFRVLVRLTGFTKRQLNKWFWDRKKKVRDAIKAKRLSYPGLLFEITNIKTGQDLTPSFKTIICNQPIFQIEKVYQR